MIDRKTRGFGQVGFEKFKIDNFQKIFSSVKSTQSIDYITHVLV